MTNNYNYTIQANYIKFLCFQLLKTQKFCSPFPSPKFKILSFEWWKQHSKTKSNTSSFFVGPMIFGLWVMETELGCVCFSVKYFLGVKYFQVKIFSSVWLHFKKCFEKYFLVFGCILENTRENTFFTCYSHFLSFQTNI